MSDRADVTVSIVNFNTKDELRKCLDSLLNQQGVKYEIAVVDNCSDDGSLEMLNDEYSHMVGILPSDANLGFAAAQNLVVKQADGRYFFILNPDTVVTSDYMFKHMVDYMDEHPNVGILAPKVLNPDGTVQKSVRRFPSFFAAMFRQTKLGEWFPNTKLVKDYLMEDFDHNEIADVDWASGCAMMVRKSAMDNMGGFDDRFFMYCEDMDLCRRMDEESWVIRYYPREEVIHRIGASSDKVPLEMIGEHHKSMFRYFVKHNALTPKVFLIPFAALGLWLRSLALKRKVKM
ncbi:MAG: glycosyltransferase family 2 protein [Abditibacteriota bacterium]|nr:glycosyltransferase family 2 protein [Abditibacteriota bacterium]